MQPRPWSLTSREPNRRLMPAPRKLGSGSPAASFLGARTVSDDSLRKLRSLCCRLLKTGNLRREVPFTLLVVGDLVVQDVQTGLQLGDPREHVGAVLDEDLLAPAGRCEPVVPKLGV